MIFFSIDLLFAKKEKKLLLLFEWSFLATHLWQFCIYQQIYIEEMPLYLSLFLQRKKLNLSLYLAIIYKKKKKKKNPAIVFFIIIILCFFLSLNFSFSVSTTE